MSRLQTLLRSLPQRSTGARPTANAGGVAPLRGPWLMSALSKSVATRQIAVAMDPTLEIQPIGTSPKYHGYDSLAKLYSAAQGIISGSVTKSVPGGNLNSAVFNVTAGTAAAGFGVIGWKVRWNGSLQYFSGRPIIISVGPVLNTAGTLSIPSPAWQGVLYSRGPISDFLVLSCANAGGRGMLFPGTQDQVVAASATTTGYGISVASISDSNQFVTFESVNQMDLADMNSPVASSRDEGDDESALYDYYASMRDG